jgi:hypothetical protein
LKYSKRFEEDFELYWRLRHKFTFAPFDVLKNRPWLEPKTTLDVKQAFFQFDTHGKLFAIADQQGLVQTIAAKASLNFHIKMYAEDRAKGELGRVDLLDIQREYELPDWFIDSVEKQKVKHYRYVTGRCR